LVRTAGRRIPSLSSIQGTTMLRMIRDGYRRRGWLVRQG
jgi:hypothetical protein